MPVRRMRVAFVAPLHFGADSYVGGGERYPLNVARGVAAANPSVHVELIAMGAKPFVRSLQPRLHLRVLPVTLEGGVGFDHVSSAIVEALEPADIVHVHQAFTRPSQLAILTAKLLGKPVVVTDHGGRTNHVDESTDYLRIVDSCVFQSRFAADQLSESIDRRLIIPGGVDDRFFCPPRRAIVRKHVLFVGRLLPHKGVDRMLCALPKDVPCIIAGRPYDLDYVRYLRALAVTRTVTFLEDADDLLLRYLYRGAWATIMPSVHQDAWGRVYEAPELMGLTALESMACATPTIVSSAAALPEFVRDGETGFVFEDLDELFRHIDGFASGHTDAAHLGANARTLVEREYSLATVGERLSAVYADILRAQDSCGS